jgi:transglutaminase-like putative cysteine protease
MRSNTLLCVLLAATPLNAAEPDWFLLDAKHLLHASDPKHPACKRRPLVCLAFTPNDDWVALAGGTDFFTSDTSLPVCVKLRQLRKDPAVRTLEWVAFTPTGGWVILHDRNRFAAGGIPESAGRTLRELAEAGTALRSIAFAPGGGWVILSGEDGVWHDRIPEAAAAALERLVKKQVPVTCVTFTSAGDWFILTGGKDVQTSRADHPVLKKLPEDGAIWLAFSPGDSPTGYTITATPARRVKAELSATITMPNAEVEEWTVYAPQAPAFGGQKDVKTTLTPDGKVTQELSQLKRPLLVSRVRGKAKEVRPVLSVEATLMARRLLPRVAGAASVPDLPPAEVKLYTRATPTMDLAARAFGEWLDANQLRRRDKEDEIALARRAYSFIKHRYTYDGKPDQDVHASVLCRTERADCGGLSSLFVATLRAGGVPARLLQGRWAKSDVAGEKLGDAPYGQWHVQAEFFAKGVGWVPVDVSGAVSDRERGEFACFGNDPGDFVTMHLDHDLVLPTVGGGKEARFGLQRFTYGWRGKGSAKGERMQDRWTVEAERIAE